MRYQPSDTEDKQIIGLAAGPDSQNLYEVGRLGVTQVLEHPAQGEGDHWFYDVYFEDGHIERVFDVTWVKFAAATEGGDGV